MPKRISKPRLDVVQNARRVVIESIIRHTEPEAPGASPELVSQVMAEMGRKGGRIGGKRRLETLSGRRRSQIAKNAAKVRWSKKK
jgi:hypothetical protein